MKGNVGRKCAKSWTWSDDCLLPLYYPDIMGTKQNHIRGRFLAVFLSESIMETCSLVLTFESVGEILQLT